MRVPRTCRPPSKSTSTRTLANEHAYWQAREQLLNEYRGRWVAFHTGQVIASGDNLLDVLDEAGSAGCHAYVALVGEEDSVVFTVRRKEFDYDRTYRPFPLPLVEATFSNYSGTSRQFYAAIIPDTGADLSVLPESDCLAFDLFSSPFSI